MTFGSTAAARRPVDAGIVVTAFMRPIAFTCSAMRWTSAALRSSPITIPGGLGCEVSKHRGALGRSCMKDDLMAVIEKRPRRLATEPISAAGDKNARH